MRRSAPLIAGLVALTLVGAACSSKGGSSTADAAAAQAKLDAAGDRWRFIGIILYRPQAPYTMKRRAGYGAIGLNGKPGPSVPRMVSGK